jgi:hypothetical protein
MARRRSLRVPSHCWELVQGADHRERAVPLAGAQVVLCEATELRGIRPLLLGLVVAGGRLRVAVRIREEPPEDRIGGRFARALGEQLGERVVGGFPGGAGADQFQELDGQRPDDGDLDVIEGDGRAAAGERFEGSWHGGDSLLPVLRAGASGHLRSCWRVAHRP